MLLFQERSENAVSLLSRRERSPMMVPHGTVGKGDVDRITERPTSTAHP